MKFLDFFKEIDDNRRRSKRIIINVLYFLAPVVMLATSFTNEQIISKCEDIHHYNTSLEQEVIELKNKCNQPVVPKPNPNMQRKISELERNNRALKQEIDALKNKDNSELVEQNRKYREEISELEQQIDAGERVLTANREQLSQSMREIRELKAALTSQTAIAPPKQNNVEDLQNRLTQLSEKNADLQNRLNICENTKPTYAVKIMPINQIPTASQRTATRLRPLGRFQISVNGQFAGYIVTDGCPK